ncbi:MAG TPA: hypothetical protein VMJ32_02940 [Pirellulales bacterium]|nr:hypothetical protein [Pirellulales bacterium]
METVFSAAAVICTFVALPLWMFFSLRQKSMGELMFGERGKRTSRSGLGNALMELDRLVTRPSVEYRVKAEDEDRLVEDEAGGD